MANDEEVVMANDEEPCAYGVWDMDNGNWLTNSEFLLFWSPYPEVAWEQACQLNDIWRSVYGAKKGKWCVKRFR